MAKRDHRRAVAEVEAAPSQQTINSDSLEKCFECTGFHAFEVEPKRPIIADPAVYRAVRVLRLEARLPECETPFLHSGLIPRTSSLAHGSIYL